MIYWDRFISYIFRYHNLLKCENTGFAKVQKMSGHGKMYISLKDRIKGNGVYSVYFYRETLREDVSPDSMIPVLLYMGKIILKNGRGDGTITFDWENVRMSGRPITAWSGIIIKRADDENSNYDIFCSSWTDNEVDYSYAFEEEIDEDVSEDEKDFEEDDSTDDENDENDEDGARITAAEILETMKGDSRADELLASREKLPLLPSCPDNEMEVATCVKINPNDIGLLNMDNWRLGVNSFLTHGFYSYKYLMLGRIEFGDAGKASYILGVPGEYSSKEKYLANIFGFDRFIPAQETKIKTGSFGYWVVDLK